MMDFPDMYPRHSKAEGLSFLSFFAPFIPFCSSNHCLNYHGPFMFLLPFQHAFHHIHVQRATQRNLHLWGQG